MKANAKLYVE